MERPQKRFREAAVYLTERGFRGEVGCWVSRPGRWIVLVCLLLLAACQTSEEPTRQLGEPLLTFTPSSTTTPSSPELTATRFIADATTTGVFVAENPESAPTPTDGFVPLAAGSCVPGESNRLNGRISGLIQTRIDEASLKDTIVSVIETEITDCTAMPTITGVQYIISITVSNIQNDAALADLATSLLAVLMEFPPQNQPAALSIRFEQGDQQRRIETDYTRSRAHYRAGLRGAELVAALGGLQ